MMCRLLHFVFSFIVAITVFSSCTKEKPEESKVIVKSKAAEKENTSNHRYRFSENGKTGFIDCYGRVAIPAIMRCGSRFDSSGLNVYLENNKVGIIDIYGNVLIPATFDGIGRFSEGLAVYDVEDPTKKYSAPGRTLHGYIDKKGNIVIPARFRYARAFSEGLAAVSTVSREFLFVDRDGDTVLRDNYVDASSFEGGLAHVKYKEKPKEVWVINKKGERLRLLSHIVLSEYKEGLAVAVATEEEVRYVEESNFYFINRMGDVVIPGPFERADPFRDGFAPVQLDGLWGYIDANGEIRIQPQYQQAQQFSEGIASVTLDSESPYRWGAIDKEGHWVIPPKFQFLGAVKGGVAYARQDSTKGYINLKGEWIYKMK